MRELKRKTEENPRTRWTKRLILPVTIITIFMTFSVIIIFGNYYRKGHHICLLRPSNDTYSNRYVKTGSPYILGNQTHAEYQSYHQGDE